MPLSAILKHQRAAWTALSVILWAVIIVLSLLPGQERPHTGYSGNLEHLVAYVGTAGVTALAFRSVAPVWLVLSFAGASALMEIAQLYIPGRSSGLDNLLASSLGATLGVIAARWVAQPLLDRWTPPTPEPPGKRG